MLQIFSLLDGIALQGQGAGCNCRAEASSALVEKQDLSKVPSQGNETMKYIP